jgi:hypothetical protein
MQTITVGSSTYTLIALPASPGFSDLTLTMEDQVAVVESPYAPGSAQTQIWPGADRWSLELALPKMTRMQAAPWKAFLAALQGKANVFQIGDPTGRTPQGVALGAPVVDGTVSGGNALSVTVLCTRGWNASVYGQLQPDDYLQIGARLYQVTQEVASDASGKAQISIWPSLRETPADGTAISLVNTVGVFRLATNKRQWHTTNDRLTQISFGCTEVR